MSQEENKMRQKLDAVKAAEKATLLAKAEYVFETCKSIIEDDFHDSDSDDFIQKMYDIALEINDDR